MRRILVFAKTPYSKTPYDRWLEGTGIEPVVLTTDGYAEEYRRHLRHVYAFADYDTNQLVDKTALRLARELGVEAVFARAEADVLRAARLRDLLDLPGQRTASALAFRDKVVMKDHLKDHLAGGPVGLPDYRQVESAYTVLEFVEEHGYPVVVKPVSESGSLGAAVIRDEAELDAYLASPWRGTSMVETFVEGQMFHIDGLVAGGEVVFVQPFRYVNDCLSFRSNDWVASLALEPGNPVYGRLVEATRAVLDRLPTPENTAFHCELWVTPDDRLVFCEIASRTGGGMIATTLIHARGIDVDREWLYAECGLAVTPADPVLRPFAGMCIPPLNGVLEYLPAEGEPDCVHERVLHGASGQTFHGGVKSGLFLAGYAVAGSSEEDVVANMARVHTWFAETAKWRPLGSEEGAR
ncbi:ATP-grasp domain-containing protein [Streptoverticillium reticulum]|uniref:ATP-grasp domain-containing protein n=1 Tax=Streptoverticillium reticulum TaxID=1433415 RepID=UPI0039BF964C